METKEWAKQSEEIFKSWSENQKKLWNEWLKVVPNFGKPPCTEIWERTVDTWSQTIQSLLDAQIQTVRQWAEHFTAAKGTPQETADWVKQGQETITRLTETQKELWESWFEVVKRFDVSNAVNWASDGQKLLHRWQETIQKTLDTQADWAKTMAGTRKKA